MGTLSINARNLMVDAVGDVALWVSAHTANPGETGTSEVTGGSPAYARKAISHGASASGAATMDSASPELDIPASTTVTHLGLFSASTAGTFYGYHDVTDEVFSSQGVYRVTDSDITASA